MDWVIDTADGEEWHTVPISASPESSVTVGKDSVDQYFLGASIDGCVFTASEMIEIAAHIVRLVYGDPQ